MAYVSIMEAHFTQWLPLWHGYLEFYKSSLAPEITDIVFKRLCDPDEKNMGGFIAFDGANAIGLVHYIVPVSYTHLDVYKRQIIY